MACTNAVLQALTPEDFKNQFWRDFNFVETWLVGSTYNTGTQVFYSVNKKFYQCLNDGVIGVLPTVTTDWKVIPNSGLISDLDITNAYAEACVSYNDTLFDSDELILAYLYLTAHFLVNDLNASGAEGGGVGLANSRSVGSVSESYTIPQAYLDNPQFAFLSKSSYGTKYLNMLIPKIVGNMAPVCGATIA